MSKFTAADRHAAALAAWQQQVERARRLRAELLRLLALREVERVKRQLAAEAPAPAEPGHGQAGLELDAPADPAQSGQGAVSCKPPYTGNAAP